MGRWRETLVFRWPLLWGGGFLALLVWSYQGTQGDLPHLFTGEAIVQILDYVVTLFPPDLSPPLLKEAAWGAAETFAISFMGTLLAVFIASPLAFLASSTLTHSGLLFAVDRPSGISRMVRVGLYGVARAILNLLRTVPELIWALIFVFVTGLGPFPGVLALGVHTGGVLGKLFAEAIENLDPTPLEALQSTGASRLQIFFYGILPQALPQLLSYTLYRWEVNIRAAAILGFVGAGGLGQRIHIALSLFWEHQLLTYLLALYLLVTAVDALSAYLRRAAL
jgi:phosphonate transport system permease protein